LINLYPSSTKILANSTSPRYLKKDMKDLTFFLDSANRWSLNSKAETLNLKRWLDPCNKGYLPFFIDRKKIFVGLNYSMFPAIKSLIGLILLPTLKKELT